MTRHEKKKQQSAMLRAKAKLLFRGGMAQVDIAKRLRVSKQYIGQIVRES